MVQCLGGFVETGVCVTCQGLITATAGSASQQNRRTFLILRQPHYAVMYEDSQTVPGDRFPHRYARDSHLPSRTSESAVLCNTG